MKLEQLFETEQLNEDCAKAVFKKFPDLKTEDEFFAKMNQHLKDKGYSRTRIINTMNDRDYLADEISEYRSLQKENKK